MRLSITIGSALSLVMLCGCATKNHGRMSYVSELEKREYTCREIELELAKVDAFLDQVSENSKVDGRSVLGFLGDFGIGNSMERSAAEKSARERRAQLEELKTEKGCP
jgi:hypothetical protein